MAAAPEMYPQIYALSFLSMLDNELPKLKIICIRIKFTLLCHVHTPSQILKPHKTHYIVAVSIYIDIYIYRERERERDTQKYTKLKSDN